MDFLAQIEQSAFSTWLRESNVLWAYPAILTLHTVGLALLVGANTALDLRLLGAGRRIPLSGLANSFRVMWIGFWINAVSGAMLFAADATARWSSRLFMVKLGLVGIGVTTIILIKWSAFRTSPDGTSVSGLTKVLAVTSLIAWTTAIAAGRFLAYV